MQVFWKLLHWEDSQHSLVLTPPFSLGSVCEHVHSLWNRKNKKSGYLSWKVGSDTTLWHCVLMKKTQAILIYHNIGADYSGPHTYNTSELPRLKMSIQTAKNLFILSVVQFAQPVLCPALRQSPRNILLGYTKYEDLGYIWFLEHR